MLYSFVVSDKYIDSLTSEQSWIVLLDQMTTSFFIYKNSQYNPWRGRNDPVASTPLAWRPSLIRRYQSASVGLYPACWIWHPSGCEPPRATRLPDEYRWWIHNIPAENCVSGFGSRTLHGLNLSNFTFLISLPPTWVLSEIIWARWVHFQS